MLVELQGEDTIDAHTFANACVRMKGAATSIDLQTVMFTTHLMNKDWEQHVGFAGGVCRRLTQHVECRERKINMSLTGRKTADIRLSVKCISCNYRICMKRVNPEGQKFSLPLTASCATRSNEALSRTYLIVWYTSSP